MVFPYRTPAQVEPEPLSYPCTEPYGGHGHCTRTRHFSPPLHCVRAHEPAQPRPDPGLRHWARAVSAASLAFLAMSTITMATLAWNASHAYLVTAAAPKVHHTKVRPAKVRHATPPPPARRPPPHFDDPPRSARAAASPAGPTFSLSALGRPTHDPTELWARARKLGTAGLGVILSETRMPVGSVDDLVMAFPPTRIAHDPGVRGVRIYHLPQGSLARAVGLQDSDVITAVNGHELISPETTLEAYSSIQQPETAVVEIRRGERPLVIKVGWATGTR